METKEEILEYLESKISKNIEETKTASRKRFTKIIIENEIFFYLIKKINE